MAVPVCAHLLGGDAPAVGSHSVRATPRTSCHGLGPGVATTGEPPPHILPLEFVRLIPSCHPHARHWWQAPYPSCGFQGSPRPRPPWAFVASASASSVSWSLWASSSSHCHTRPPSKWDGPPPNTVAGLPLSRRCPRSLQPQAPHGRDPGGALQRPGGRGRLAAPVVIQSRRRLQALAPIHRPIRMQTARSRKPQNLRNGGLFLEIYLKTAQK